MSRLDSFSIDDGLQLSSWTSSLLLNDDNGTLAAGSNSGDDPAVRETEFNPPTKRRRLSNDDTTKETSENGRTENQETPHHEETVLTFEAPAFIALESTTDGNYVIAVTGEDKSIRVFEHDGRGHLRLLSRRPMPKRPCAIAIKGNDSTIISADKFGDVYSLPLLVSSSIMDGTQAKEQNRSRLPILKSSKPFTPAANDLTVHSVRNRTALKNQMRQNQQASLKSEPEFERHLLFGHVSMLTDLALAENMGRSYIITADRDEHIRISRGMPQAHVIEGYCLGHKNLINQLCLPTGRPGILISGGGDDEIYIWDWRNCKLLHRVNLRSHVEKVLSEITQNSNLSFYAGNSKDASEPVKFVVSHVHNMYMPQVQHNESVLVTCERIPAVFVFSLLGESNLLHQQTLMLEGNALDVSADGSTGSVIISIDCMHQPGSTSEIRISQNSAVNPLVRFEMTASELVRTPNQFNYKSNPEDVRELTKDDFRGLSSLLYNLENLRKRGGEE